MMKGFAMTVCPLLLGLVSVGAASSQTREVALELRPSKDFVQSLPRTRQAMPFFAAVPLAQARVVAAGKELNLSCGGQAVPARVYPSAFWPDGSVQWLSIDGVWPAEVNLSDTMPVAVSIQTRRALRREAPRFKVVRRRNTIGILRAKGEMVAVLRPEASVLRITKPKRPVSRKPEDQDTTVQYAWAEQREELNPEAKPTDLRLRIREFKSERETQTYVLYRVRGDGGTSGPGQQLEWQLRARVYRQTPLIRFQMTWVMQWDPKEYALASAKWIAEIPSSRSFAEARRPGAKPLSLGDGPVRMESTPQGRSRIVQEADEVHKADLPDPSLHAWALNAPDSWLALSLPNFTKLGPNRLTLKPDSVEVACWDGDSGYALDLRRTVERDEFGMNDYDFDANAAGLARTVEMTWAWRDSSEAALALALSEARRDGLWFPSRDDIVKTRALGPWKPGAFQRNRARLEMLAARIHWVMASRKYWRWYGFANYGDIRTNWTRKDALKYGLHGMRWGMHGRYGWRNGSAEPFRGFLTYGLFTEDRDMILAAFDYAAHVVDVDVCHGSFFAKLSGDQGGMHRRNKNHWSGDVQMQYTTSRGLYVMRWLTGYERFGDTLAEIRDFAARRPGSIFAPAAWLNRYTETHDPKILAAARRLLAKVTASWDGRARSKPEFEPLKGLASLYAGNFRSKLDCWPALIEFHRATGDDAYLRGILDSVRAHKMEDPGTGDLSRYYAIAYLLANDISEDQIGADKVARFRKRLKEVKHPTPPPRSTWNYVKLLNSYCATYQTAELGWRASFAPLVFSYFDSAE